MLSALKKFRLLSWIIRKREDSYTTELDGGGEERFERMVIYVPLLTLLLRGYLSGERLWKLAGHDIDPQFRRLVSSSSPLATSRGGKTSFWTMMLAASAVAVIGGGAAYYVRKMQA